MLKRCKLLSLRAPLLTQDDIEVDEVDPSLISSYGVGNRPSRRAASKPIDYSSEEALRKAGVSTGGGSNDDDEDDDQEFKGVSAKSGACNASLTS